jgi:methylglutamate dehydrogenase subunit C
VTELTRKPGEPRYRLSQGGLIDRQRLLSFDFDGRRYHGYSGDTLASALLASGVRIMGRSFKYHRPRGVLTAGSEEPNGLVELRTGARREPNTRATVVELFDGLIAQSQNRWPSLRFDLGAVNGLLAPFLPAGFYYKTFMWPPSFWEKVYEPAIRRAAGLGRASVEPDPDEYEKAHAFCDVLVIGSGPAGLAAALSAGRSGARVMLCEEDFVIGGRLNGERYEINGRPGTLWAHQTEAELVAMPQVRLLRRTTVFGAYDGGTFAAVERVSDHLPTPPPRCPRQRLWKIVAKRVVLATGAIERTLVFPGNDRPGVMMASAVRTYLHRFGITSGHRVVVVTTTDDGWKTAFDLAQAGVEVTAIVDQREEIALNLLVTAKRHDLPVLAGATVIGAEGVRGLRRVLIQNHAGHRMELPADMLAMSGGWNPNLALSTHLGARPRWLDRISAFVPGDGLRGMIPAGAAAGSFSLAEALRQGAAAGATAAESSGFNPAPLATWKTDEEPIGTALIAPMAKSPDKAFVDFQHDVTQADIALAVREGFASAEHLKRYTTLGMATEQGKTGQVNGLALLAFLTGRSVPEVGTTTFRPPYTPVALGALAGHARGKHFRPTRLTPSHGWAQEQGATFMEAGEWLRARWFATAGEKDWLEAVTREVQAVRSCVGVCDVSTLGKIDIQGPDAGLFLDRIYANTFSTLPIGKVRYGLMLREDGFVLDDGTSAHFAPHRYIMSTTTANAAKVLRHLEHARQVLWTELDVQLACVTDQWAQFAIAGPNARQLLERLLRGAVDASNSSFPYLACAEFQWEGIRTRLFRISFSGELAYELAVPARYGDALIRALMTTGEDLGIVPYGTEALGVLRIEKGHVAGNELNGTTTAADLRLGRLMSNKKDFIGRVMAARPGLTDPGRTALVGIKPLDRNERLRSGAHFLPKGVTASAENDEGYVTSVAYSPTLGHWIGLGLLKQGPHRLGESIRAYDPLHESDVPIEVCPPTFVDPTGARLHG